MRHRWIILVLVALIWHGVITVPQFRIKDEVNLIDNQELNISSIVLVDNHPDILKHEGDYFVLTSFQIC